MSKGASLVIRGTIMGSVIVALLGWLLATHIKLLPTTEVAYAASASSNINQPATKNNSTTTNEVCSVNPGYPKKIRQWCEIITRFAAQAELPANLVAAVILQESGGNANAFSACGAVGLMQVMPRDGIASSFECINGPCFASRPTIEELQDPSFNIEYGTRMLAGLTNRLGSLREALKAYGPIDIGYSYADRVLAIYDKYR
jgi:soluble lytic murein transglycosylase-like protein